MARGSDVIETARYPLTGKFMAGRSRDRMDEADLLALEAMVDRQRTLEGGEVFVSSDIPSREGAILIDGFLFRTIRDGARRHIVGLHVPGDIVNFNAFTMERSDHDLVSAGRARIGIIPQRGFDATVAERHGLARALWFAVLVDAAVQRKWTQVLGHLDAPRKIAHVYCEIQRRLAFTGEACRRAVRTPFTQFDLGDMCGVSTVHANRAISKLRESKIAEIRRGTLYTHDWDALERYARFEPGYLYGGNRGKEDRCMHEGVRSQ